jgi:hypothetical protein
VSLYDPLSCLFQALARSASQMQKKTFSPAGGEITPPLAANPLSDLPFAHHRLRFLSHISPPRLPLAHLLHGNTGHEPDERGRDGAGLAMLRWHCWVMNPQARAHG